MDDGLEEQALPLADVRSLLRLLARCGVVEGGVMAQKRCLGEGLAELLHCDYWMWNVSRLMEDGGIVAVSLLHNLSERQLALLARENYSSPNNPCNEAMVELSSKHSNWSRRLEDLVDLEAEAGRLYTENPELDIGRSLFAFQRVEAAPELSSCIGLHRSHGKEPYSLRELRLLDIVWTEVGWLHEDSLPPEDGHSTSSLPPRHQTVLSLLIDGQSTKRVAFNLDLSPHTVRGYVKDIYKHFKVGSRSELMRHFMVGDGSDRPT